MASTVLPQLEPHSSETGCCPRFNPDPWDRQEFLLDDWPFVRATTISFLREKRQLSGPFLPESSAAG
ncbi:MAG: hydrolase, partial [Thermoguttaceae bacterium]